MGGQAEEEDVAAVQEVGGEESAAARRDKIKGVGQASQKLPGAEWRRFAAAE